MARDGAEKLIRKVRLLAKPNDLFVYDGKELFSSHNPKVQHGPDALLDLALNRPKEVSARTTHSVESAENEKSPHRVSGTTT